MNLIPDWFSRKKKTRIVDHHRPKDRQTYEAHYTATLKHLVSMLDQDVQKEQLAILKPVYLDAPAYDESDFLTSPRSSPYRDDLLSFTNTLQQTFQQGLWAGFGSVMTIQPELCLQISKRVHKKAIQSALLANQPYPRALPIGPSSIYFLIALNNILFLDYRLTSESSDTKRSIFSFFKRKSESIWHVELKSEINLAMMKLQQLHAKRSIGDLVFFHTAVPFLTHFQESPHVAYYLKRLIVFSPMTIAERLTDPDIWETITNDALAGISKLFDASCSFQFMNPMIQTWVDVLVSAEEDEFPNIFTHVEQIFDVLNDTIQARCLMQFIRVLTRTWSDEQSQEMLLAHSPEQAAVWHDVFSRLLNRVDRICPETMPALDHQILQHLMVMAERGMGRVAS